MTAAGVRMLLRLCHVPLISQAHRHGFHLVGYAFIEGGAQGISILQILSRRAARVPGLVHGSPLTGRFLVRHVVRIRRRVCIGLGGAWMLNRREQSL